ncbi:hypothetical protein [Haloarchaeobius sp. DT45]|uniref:hypothetical protein n=1 Tax=Haloarchaeobius sp. DT45 TaxID=3446116 RepID=UPI003F6BB214
MSSITIEVDDPDKAYESVLELFEAAPVDFSQVTSVRLEIEYDAGEDGDESDDEASGADVDSKSAGDARQQRASITDAEGRTIPSTFGPEGDDTDDATVDGADEITFGSETSATGDGDPFGASSASDPGASIFGTDADATADSEAADTGDSIFESTTDDGGTDQQRSTEPDDTNGVTFEDPGTTADPVDTESTDPTAPRGDDGPTPSPRTYNKVMRLLQNRDFPIERSQIEAVAAGAYDVDPDECRTIVDAAIDKGLVAQDGPMLVDPTE